MAAAMDVDTPSGANSGASKKRFEVKKVQYWDVIVEYWYQVYIYLNRLAFFKV